MLTQSAHQGTEVPLPSLPSKSFLFLPFSTPLPVLPPMTERDSNTKTISARNGTHGVDASPAWSSTISKRLSGPPLQHLLGLLAQVPLALASAWWVCTPWATSLALPPRQSDPPGFPLGPLLPRASRHSAPAQDALRLPTVPA